MRKFGIFIGIILYSCNLLAITIEEEKFYGPKKNEPDLNILSSTDINIFECCNRVEINTMFSQESFHSVVCVCCLC